MDTEKEIREAIEYEIGEILRWEQIAPGIFYAAAQEESLLTDERYVLKADNPIISDRAKAYAEPLVYHPEYLSYVYDRPESGKMILEYEAYRYLLANHLPLPEHADIQETASFGREHHPEYFGDYSAPPLTPLGVTLRYQRLMFGTFLIETDKMQRGLAVCNPLYSCDLTDFTVAEGVKSDKRLPESCNYLVFSEQSACLALFELAHNYKEIAGSEYLDFPAMMNAIWKRYPAYAARHNLNEQTGYGHIGTFLAQVENGGVSPEYLISMTEDLKTNYLKF